MRNAVVFVTVLLSAAAAHAGQEADRVTTFVTRARVPLESKEVKGAPYSAETVNDRTQMLADGNRIVEHSTGRVYRDRDGRVRREEDRAGGSPAISIVDPVAGVSYSLDPDTHMALKTPTPGIMATLADMAKMKVKADTMTLEVTDGRVEVRRSGSRVEQRSSEALPDRTIEGISAHGHRTTTTIAAGAIGNDLPIVVTSEEWASPDLQVLVLTERKDPRNGDSTYRLLNINRSDPDPSLFQVPSDYTIKPTGIRRFEMR